MTILKALGVLFLWLICLGLLVASLAVVAALACLAFVAIVGG